MSRWIFVTTVLLVGAIATGCKLGGGLQVEPVSVSAKPPSNVLLYVSIARDGQQVPDLGVDNFHITEDGVTLDNKEIHLTVLPRDLQAVHEAVVLVDMSRTLGPIERASLSKNLQGFVAKLRRRRAVTVYAYDGAGSAHFIGRYERDLRAEAEAGDTRLDRLMDFNRQDASTSLYSAVVSGAEALERALEKSKRPVTVGSIITIAQGPDVAGRVSEERAWEFVHDSPHRYYLVTVGSDAAGAPQRASFGVLAGALDHLAQRIDEVYSQYYLIGYCSPARSGPRMVALSVESTDEQGQRIIGYLDTEIDASGFGPGCGPDTFGVPAAPPPPAAIEEAAQPEEAKPKPPPRKPAGGKKPKIAAPPPGLGYE